MSSISACGLLETPYNCFIDHLAPLCSYLDIPILSSRAETLFLFQRYYPDITFKIKNWSIRYLLENYTTILYSFNPIPGFNEIIDSEHQKNPDDPIWKKRLKLIYHFHGCSDKGYHSKWIEPDSHLKDLDLLLIYGPRFEKLLKDKKVYNAPKKVLEVGNYRLQYYLKHKEYYDQLVQKEVFSQFEKKQKTLLYAPTWNDPESSSSFLEIYETLFKTLPSDINLLVKLHPNMTLKTDTHDPTEILKIIEKYKHAPNVLIMSYYPIMYPLLNVVDLYLGDHSSVGYDMLYFQKPMFFLNVKERTADNPGALIFNAGSVIQKEQFSKLYTIINSEKKSYTHEQIELYEYAFGKCTANQDTLKQFKNYVLESIEKSNLSKALS